MGCGRPLASTATISNRPDSAGRIAAPLRAPALPRTSTVIELRPVRVLTTLLGAHALPPEYAGRADDVFKSAGYRIGPGEIESCLVGHPAVANAAVVPKPDPERGALVKAYVVLTPEFAQRERGELVESLQEHVRERLAPYEYPKEIEFVDELPMTTTGKIQRRILRQREEDLARLAAATTDAPPASKA